MLRAIADLVLLQVNRELLFLPEQKAGERRACIRRAREIRQQIAEREHAGRRGGLQYVEALPSQIGARFDGVPPLQPRQCIREFCHAGAEVARRISWRSELLIAGDEKRRERVLKVRGRGDSIETQAGRSVAWESNGGARDGSSGVADPQLVQHVARQGALVVGGEGPGRRVLRTQRARCQPAPIRQGRHRDERFLKPCEPPKHLIARCDAVVQPHAELLLIDDLAAVRR
jgi:hypothetical protein